LRTSKKERQSTPWKEYRPRNIIFFFTLEEKIPSLFFLNAGIAGEKAAENPEKFDLALHQQFPLLYEKSSIFSQSFSLEKWKKNVVSRPFFLDSPMGNFAKKLSLFSRAAGIAGAP